MTNHHAVPSAVALLISLSALQGQAAPAGPFTEMAGSWAGAGSLKMANGAKEQLRCRANYRVGGNGSEVQLRLRCASESYNFNFAGDVESNGRAVSGSWSETTRNASGTVSGRISGDRIQVVARGDSFSASLSLVTRGNRQSVAIQPQGTEISEVSITLAKGQPTTTGATR
jgi:hypothetical protein